MSMTELPEEIILDILEHLPLKDLLAVACTCHRLNEVVPLAYHKRNLQRAQETLKRPVPSDSIVSYPDVRHELLRAYGWLYGLWHIKSTVYGGLLHVTFEGFQMLGFRYSDSDQLSKPLRKMILFYVSVVGGASGPVCVTACNRFDCRHDEIVHQAIIEKLENQDVNITCDRTAVKSAKKVLDSREWLERRLDALIYTNSVNEGMISVTPIGLLRSAIISRSTGDRFDAFQSETSVVCSRLDMPSDITGAIIEPGFFKGPNDYGLELVQLTYSGDMKTAIVTRITGNRQLPTGRIIIEADLEQPNTTSGVDESAGASLDSTEGKTQEQKRYSYDVPNGYRSFSDRDYTIPSLCIGRYRSRRTKDENGNIDEELIVFDEKTFGHQSKKSLSTFTVYTRIEETFQLYPSFVD